MPTFNRNLNIHYSLPKEYWDKIASIYQTMPSWIGYIDGIPHWFSDGTKDKVINASVEPSGLQFYAIMSEKEWNEWFELFQKRATGELGFEVGEPEDGHHFYTTT